MKVYPVDLMRLYLTRRNLDAIAGIDLAGITPFYEATIKLGDGQDFDDKARAIDLPLKKEGAYLVMVRGDDLYASGIVLVSPLELEVLEEAESGRVRVTVRDAAHQGARAQGPGQGDRHRQPGVLLGRDRPARRVRRRGRARPGHGRGPQGRRTSTPSTAAPPTSARPRPPANARRREPASRPQQPPGQPLDLQQNVRGQNSSQPDAASSSGWSSATTPRTRA